MNTVWLILAVLSFIGGQAYLFLCLGRLDVFLVKRPAQQPAFTYDDNFRYWDDYASEAGQNEEEILEEEI